MTIRPITKGLLFSAMLLGTSLPVVAELPTQVTRDQCIVEEHVRSVFDDAQMRTILRGVPINERQLVIDQTRARATQTYLPLLRQNYDERVRSGMTDGCVEQHAQGHR